MDAELAALLRAVQAKLAQEAQSDLTVRALWEKYSQSPEATALRCWATEVGRGKHLVRLLGDIRVGELTLIHLDDYRKTRATESGPRKQTTKPATRNREVVRLVRVLNWAVERKMIPANPIDGAPLEPEENTRRTSLEEAHVEAMRTACGDYKPDCARVGLTLRAMISTAFDSGLRRAELCRLLRSQLRVREGMIELHELDTKARRGRVTILSERAADDIRAMPRDLRHKDSPFVFLTTRGKPYHPRTYLRMYQEVAELAGFEAAPGERPWAHDTRGGFVGQQLELGTPERDIMDMGGWSTREVFDRYHRRRGAGAVLRAKQRLDAKRAERVVQEPDNTETVSSK